MTEPAAGRETTEPEPPKKRAWRAAGRSLSKLTYSALRHGALPVGARGVRTLVKEGRKDLHWKVLGDSLVRIAQTSGPLLTKVGQVLATRDDLLPPAVCRRLEALYADQPAMAEPELKAILERAYPDGAPFTIEPKPLGVGSVGQVHRGRLSDEPDGEQDVVVKIVRPHVEEAMERDLLGARALLGLLVRFTRGDREATRTVLTRALDDLAQGFRRETDLTAEAATLVEFAQRFRKNKRVCVPRCYREHSSRQVLVMEELKGEPLSAYRERAKTDPAAAKRVAALALKEILRQVFEYGRFHADPHAGNLLVLEDGRLGLVDLGLTGEFGPQQRKSVTAAVKAFLAKSPEKVISALLGLGDAPDDLDTERFQEDVLQVVRRRQQLAAGDPDAADGGDDTPTGLEQFVNDLFKVAHRHRIDIPSSTTLLIKSLVTVEGVARSLDPDINLARVALPVVVKAMRPRWFRWDFWRRDPGD